MAVCLRPMPSSPVRRAERHAPLTVVDLSRLTIEDGDLDAVTFDFDGLNGIRLPLIGGYQPRNAATAITALRVLRSRGWNIPDSAIRAGLEQVRWPGPVRAARHSPAFLLDGSHNAHGMRATVQSLRDRFPGQKFVFLLSIMADKDVDEMLTLLLPLAGQFVTVAAHTPRAMPAETLAEQIRAGAAGPSLLPPLKPVWPGGRPWGHRPRVRAGHALLLRRCAGSVCKIEPVKKRGCGTRKNRCSSPLFADWLTKKCPAVL